MKRVVKVFFGALAAATVAAWFVRDSRAADDGLYAEKWTMVDGVTVRRVRDMGAHVVCYVASGPAVRGFVDDAKSVGISCVRAEAP